MFLRYIKYRYVHIDVKIHSILLKVIRLIFKNDLQENFFKIFIDKMKNIFLKYSI